MLNPKNIQTKFILTPISYVNSVVSYFTVKISLVLSTCKTFIIPKNQQNNANLLNAVDSKSFTADKDLAKSLNSSLKIEDDKKDEQIDEAELALSSQEATESPLISNTSEKHNSLLAQIAKGIELRSIAQDLEKSAKNDSLLAKIKNVKLKAVTEVVREEKKSTLTEKEKAMADRRKALGEDDEDTAIDDINNEFASNPITVNAEQTIEPKLDLSKKIAADFKKVANIKNTFANRQSGEGNLFDQIKNGFTLNKIVKEDVKVDVVQESSQQATLSRAFDNFCNKFSNESNTLDMIGDSNDSDADWD